MKKETLEAAKTRFPTPCSQERVKQHSRDQKLHAIADHIRGIMEILGLDLADQSLAQTPQRVAEMYVDEIFSGLDLETFPEIATFEHTDSAPHDGHMVVTKVSIVSFCEHHLVPMVGEAYIGYIPQDKVIGLSKLSRIARYFAARPQLQERLTAQIGDSLATILGHNDVAVLITAQHTCVVARGAKDESSKTSTSYTSGQFQSSASLHQQFLEMAHNLRTEVTE